MQDSSSEPPGFEPTTGGDLDAPLLAISAEAVQQSGDCSPEQRPIVLHILDACATAVLKYPRYFPRESGLVLTCDRREAKGTPEARLRVSSRSGQSLPAPKNDARAFAAWSGGLRVALNEKRFNVGDIYWSEGTTNIELTLTVPALCGVAAIFQVDL